MKWTPNSLGAEPKKLAILGVLLVVLGVVYWMNSGPAAPPEQAARQQAPGGRAESAAAVAKATIATRPAASSPRVARRGDDDFVLSIDIPEGVDITKVDPRLKQDLLTRVRSVGDVGGRRSLFEFYTPPPPPPKVADIKPAPPPTQGPEPPKVAETKPAPPPPPPLTFKFFGYEGRPNDRARRALFVDGEDTFIIAEGDMLRDRYRVMRIGVTSVEVEDTVAKGRQTLQIVPAVEQ